MAQEKFDDEWKLWIGRSFKPRGGRAMIWNNLHSDGQPNPAAQHYGTPVQAGTKTIITKWFRKKGDGDMYTKTSTGRWRWRIISTAPTR